MQILGLNLVNFRNFSKKKVEFDKQLTVIVGPNGSGKSNILEAVSLLGGIKPMRIETDLDLVRLGQGEARVEGDVVSLDEDFTLRVNFQRIERAGLPAHSGLRPSGRSDSEESSESMRSKTGRQVGKSFFVNSFKKRLLDFVSIFSVVVFDPIDLDLVSGSPSLRRHHLDRFLSSVDSKYWRAASSYSKVVTRRNKVLLRIQDGKSKPLELGFWDERLLEHGKYISKARLELFEYLNFVESTDVFTPGVSQDSTSRTPGVGLNLYSWFLKQSLLTEDKLSKNRDRDIAAGVTLSGPHRDDFRFKFKGYDLEFFGSRGEQRMAVLALKLAELEYFRVKKGVRPVLALDDIFSELDWEHRDTVLSVVGNQQTIITAAEKESIPREIFKKAMVVEL